MAAAESPPPYSEAAKSYGTYNANQISEANRNFGAARDSEAFAAIGFSDESIRRNFVKKVFLLVFLQLAVVVALICVFIFVDDVRFCSIRHPWIFYVSMVVFFVVYIALGCSDSLRRKVPTNYITLLILTLSLGFLAASISSTYDTHIVAISFGITLLTVATALVLSLCCAKFDITSKIGLISLLASVVIWFGLFAILFRSEVANVAYSLLVSVVLVLYIALDVQLIVGGKRLELSPEEYIFASTQLFVDIVMLFVTLLQLIAYSRR